MAGTSPAMTSEKGQWPSDERLDLLLRLLHAHLAGEARLHYSDKPLDIGHRFGYFRCESNLAQKDAGRVMPGGRGECGACGRGLISCAPGRLGHHVCRHYDRRARCIAGLGQAKAGVSPFGAKSQETWPDAEPLGRCDPFGESRGGTPAGERARKRKGGASRLSVARPARRLHAGHGILRLPAFRFPSLFAS